MHLVDYVTNLNAPQNKGLLKQLNVEYLYTRELFAEKAIEVYARSTKTERIHLVNRYPHAWLAKQDHQVLYAKVLSDLSVDPRFGGQVEEEDAVLENEKPLRKLMVIEPG